MACPKKGIRLNLAVPSAGVYDRSESSKKGPNKHSPAGLGNRARDSHIVHAGAIAGRLPQNGDRRIARRLTSQPSLPRCQSIQIPEHHNRNPCFRHHHAVHYGFQEVAHLRAGSMACPHDPGWFEGQVGRAPAYPACRRIRPADEQRAQTPDRSLAPVRGSWKCSLLVRGKPMDLDAYRGSGRFQDILRIPLEPRSKLHGGDALLEPCLQALGSLCLSSLRWPCVPLENLHRGTLAIGCLGGDHNRRSPRMACLHRLQEIAHATSGTKMMLLLPLTWHWFYLLRTTRRVERMVPALIVTK